MKPQITTVDPHRIHANALASKELRHEAADHLSSLADAQRIIELQKSCGMKPQITWIVANNDCVLETLQKSCGMKPQIT